MVEKLNPIATTSEIPGESGEFCTVYHLWIATTFALEIHPSSWKFISQESFPFFTLLSNYLLLGLLGKRSGSTSIEQHLSWNLRCRTQHWMQSAFCSKKILVQWHQQTWIDKIYFVHSILACFSLEGLQAPIQESIRHLVQGCWLLLGLIMSAAQ